MLPLSIESFAALRTQASLSHSEQSATLSTPTLVYDWVWSATDRYRAVAAVLQTLLKRGQALCWVRRGSGLIAPSLLRSAVGRSIVAILSQLNVDPCATAGILVNAHEADIDILSGIIFLCSLFMSTSNDDIFLENTEHEWIVQFDHDGLIIVKVANEDTKEGFQRSLAEIGLCVSSGRTRGKR